MKSVSTLSTEQVSDIFLVEPPVLPSPAQSDLRPPQLHPSVGDGWRRLLSRLRVSPLADDDAEG